MGSRLKERYIWYPVGLSEKSWVAELQRRSREKGRGMAEEGFGGIKIQTAEA